MLFPFIKKIFHRHHLSIHSTDKTEQVKYLPDANEDAENDISEEIDEKAETVINIDVIKDRRKCLHRQKKFTTKKRDLEKKIHDYVQSFTIHGLTRSVTGKRTESAFWTAILAVGILCASVVIYGLIQKYYSRAVYTELISKITEKNYFPSVTFCEKTLLQDSYFAYCGIPMRDYVTKSAPTCKNRTKYKEETNVNVNSWGNSLFNITHCSSMGGTWCNSSTYFKSEGLLNNSCITWNYDGNLHDPYSHVTLMFEFRKPAHLKENVEIFAIPHDHRIKEIDITKKIEIDSDHKYEIKIDKTFVKRLPAPFPSNCTNEQVHNIFPGRYTRFSCMESYYYIDMYKRCGDVFDYHKPYIPEHIVKTYSRESPNVTSCILNYSRSELRNLKHCNFACEILDLNYYASFQTRHGKNTGNDVSKYEVGIQLKTANEYRVMEEKQLYTLSQMACEIGGFVGLIMGMSVISVIEVIVIIALSISRKIVGIRERRY